MSVKKVKISELPQLQPDASGEGLFMPASDENNRTYRVPLSRYDNAKGEADTAAASAWSAAEEANAAAQTARTAAEKANEVVNKQLANNNATPGLVKGFGTENGALPTNVFKPEGGGDLFYNQGYASTRCRPLRTNNTKPTNLKTLVLSTGKDGIGVGTLWLLYGVYLDGWRGNGAYNALAHITYGRMVAYDMTDGKTYMLLGGQEWKTAEGGTNGEAGGDLSGNYPDPVIKTGVTLDAPALKNIPTIENMDVAPVDGLNVGVTRNTIVSIGTLTDLLSRQRVGRAPFSRMQNGSTVILENFMGTEDNPRMTPTYQVICGGSDSETVTVMLPPSLSSGTSCAFKVLISNLTTQTIAVSASYTISVYSDSDIFVRPFNESSVAYLWLYTYGFLPTAVWLDISCIGTTVVVKSHPVAVNGEFADAPGLDRGSLIDVR